MIDDRVGWIPIPMNRGETMDESIMENDEGRWKRTRVCRENEEGRWNGLERTRETRERRMDRGPRRNGLKSPRAYRLYESEAKEDGERDNAHEADAERAKKVLITCRTTMAMVALVAEKHPGGFTKVGKVKL